MENLWTKSVLRIKEYSPKFFGNIFNKPFNFAEYDAPEVYLPRQSLLVKRSGAARKRLEDLNFDCLAEICQYLDVPTQFSLYKSSRNIAKKMLQGIWHGYYETGFDMDALKAQPYTEQAQGLVIVLRNFDKIENIQFNLFQQYITTARFIELQHIKYLSIQYLSSKPKLKKSLKFTAFRRFPNLEELHISNIYIDFKNDKRELPLTLPQLRKIVALTDISLERKFKDIFYSVHYRWYYIDPHSNFY